MNWLVPSQKRYIPARRWVSISLRSLHLVGIAGLAGAYLFQLPEAAWHPYLLLTLSSGVLMICKEVYADGIWLLQLCGQMVLLKLLILGAGLLWFDRPEAGVYILVILIAGVFSHAPGKVRYYSLWYRRVLTREVYFGLGKGNIKDCGES